MEAHHAIAPQQHTYYASPDSTLHYRYDDATTTPVSLSFSSFLDRSPVHYDDQAYTPYFTGLGGPSTEPVASTSTASPHVYTFGDPGMGVPGPSLSQGHPPQPSSQLVSNDFRGMYAPPSQPSWQWASPSPYGIQGQVTTPFNPDTSTHHKTSSLDNIDPLVRTPTAQLPTPAAMAVLLHSTSRNPGGESQPLLNHPPYRHQEVVLDGGEDSPTSYQTEGSDHVESGTVRQPSASEPTTREKRHACWMCHKSFDRPSTLRKHLLVHTGEKAFKCETCGRRFGVASNLNRHVRKCILRPVNALPRGSSDSPTTPDTTTTTTSSSNPAMTTTANTPRRKRGRDTSPSNSVAPPRQVDNNTEKPKPKRRRRAPSPSTWVPPSLLGFNLRAAEALKPAPVPLPPVIPSKQEERNSWDENVDVAPYHPRGWKNKLPGPGLGLGLGLGRDLRNMNLAGSGGFMLGRVAVW